MSTFRPLGHVPVWDDETRRLETDLFRKLIYSFKKISMNLADENIGLAPSAFATLNLASIKCV